MATNVKTRIENLKALGKLANKYLNEYKELKTKSNKTWVQRKCELSIQELQEIIHKINTDLHPNKVEAYCKPMPTFEGIPLASVLATEFSPERTTLNDYLSELLNQTNAQFTLFDIVRLAPEQNILHDISWLTDGSLNDYIEVALGQKSITFFDAYLPDKIDKVENWLNSNVAKEYASEEQLTLIHNAVKQSQQGNFLLSNIILITVIESIVRKLCKFILLKQDPSRTEDEADKYIYDKFNSLDSLIAKGAWKEDYPIALAEAVTRYKDVTDETMNKWREKLRKHKDARKKISDLLKEITALCKQSGLQSDEELKAQIEARLKTMEEVGEHLLSDDDHQIKISVSTMLHFLIRKYKDDRNLLAHGNFQPLNHKWKNYINFTALVRVLDFYKNYSEFYGGNA